MKYDNAISEAIEIIAMLQTVATRNGEVDKAMDAIPVIEKLRALRDAKPEGLGGFLANNDIQYLSSLEARTILKAAKILYAATKGEKE